MKAPCASERVRANGGQLARPEQASMAGLVAEVLEHVQELFEQQFEYFRQEVIADVEKTKEAGFSIGVAGVLGLVGALLVFPALIGLLAWAIPELPWWGWSGVLAVLFLAAATLLYLDAWNRIKSFNPLQRSLRRVKENVRWITKRSH